MRLNPITRLFKKRSRARTEAAAPRAGRDQPQPQPAVAFFEPLEGRTMLAGGRGFAAYYFTGTDFAHLKTRREDSVINFDWRQGGDAAVTPGGFGAHYSGRVSPKYSETYHFYTRSTGGVRVWVNNQLIINDWTTHALKDNVGSIALQAGVRYDVRIEYFDTTSVPQLQLHWRSNRQAREVVPASRLFASPFDTTRPAAPTRLKATYVTDTAYKFVWTGSTDESPGGIVYDVYTGQARMGATTETSFTRGSRNPLNSYAVSVRAVDWAGNVTASAPLVITTKAFVGAGTGSGLAGRYYDSPDFTNFRMMRTDPQVLFGWAGNPFDDGGDRNFCARWEGSVLARYDELYTFSFLTDGAMKVWIGGTLVIDQPSASAPRELTHAIKLRAGRRYSVKIEYQHIEGPDAMAAMSWSSLSTRKQVIPVEQLDPAFTDDAAPTAPGNVRVDNTTQNAISFSWDASTDDFGVVYYDVFRNGEHIGSTSNLNYTDDGLSSDTTYVYQIAAMDVAGKSSARSAPLSVRTLAPPPIRSAFNLIQATAFNGQDGISTSGNAISSLDDGDWVRYERIDFGGGSARSLKLVLGASVNGAGGTIEVRLGAPDGQVIGRHVVQPTGSYGTHYTQRFAIDGGITGLQTVYLVFKNRASVADVESLQFSTQRLVRVMPLGDSITDGQSGRNSYRYFLYKKLIDAGYGVDFVGGQIKNDGGDVPNMDFDQNHEGHSGWRADNILQNVVGWVQQYNPEIVLLHIGTNDLWRGDTIASTVDEIAQTIDAIHSVNPSIRVVVAQIIPLVNYEPQIAAFNADLATMVNAKITAGATNLNLVDMHAGFTLAGDTYDGVHPNNTGASKMADRWFETIEGFF